MPQCEELRVGNILVCENCGLQLQVTQECTECAPDDPSCGCEEGCTFECCGQPFTVRASS
jgi:hypothetical protein